MLRRLGLYILTGLYPHRICGGMRIVFADLEVDREFVIKRLGEALALLAHTDPQRYRRLHKYAKNIVVWAGHYSAAQPPHTVQISTLHLTDSGPLELASVLVHETTHLRIANCGVPYDRSMRMRIERVCIGEQAAFLRQHGGEGHAMAKVFESALDMEWWTDEAHRDDIERLAADFGLPRWMIPLMGITRKMRASIVRPATSGE